MQLTLLDLFELGGWAMWPLVVFSVATAALLIERGLVLLVKDLRVDRLGKTLVPLIREGNIAGALEACDSSPEKLLVRPIYRAAISVCTMGESRIERTFESASGRQIHTLERGLDLLVALGSIAPITGFLGTVSGMISAFNSIATAADVNAQLVAGGIFEALITTAFGLAIAIVAITGYNLFAHFIDRFAADIEEAGNELITVILSSAQ